MGGPGMMTLPFLSTLSLRRATGDRKAYVGNSLFLSTLSLRRATHVNAADFHFCGISIHALLAESDPHIHSTSPGHPCISIHALLAESDKRIFALSAY